MIATRSVGVINPTMYRQHAVAFPRSVWWGRILFAIVALWGGIVLHGALGDIVTDAQREVGNAGLWVTLYRIEPLAVPVVYWLVIQFGAPYLAIRSAAALLLLVGNHLVRAADMSMDASRLVVTTFVYIWVIFSIWATIAPHHIRDVIGLLMANDRRCQAACSVGVGLGLLFLGMGLFVY
jgi:hypothetical protein